MSIFRGNRGITRSSALVLTSLIVACDGNEQARMEDQGIVVAHATPTPVTDGTMTSTETASPRPTSVTYADAELVFRKGKYQEAAELFAVYVESNATSVSGQYMLGLSAWKSGDRGRAEQALQKAVELDGESVKARTNLGRVLIEQGRAADALPHVEKATELKPESHEVWRVLGNVKGELNRPEEALDAYTQALIRNDKDAWTMNNYGLVLIRQGRYEEALPPLARAVELMPRSPVFNNNLGIVLEQMGELGSAHKAFETAIETDSTYTKAKVSLERVQKKLAGRTTEVVDLSEFSKSFADQIERWKTPNPLNDDVQ